MHYDWPLIEEYNSFDVVQVRLMRRRQLDSHRLADLLNIFSTPEVSVESRSSSFQQQYLKLREAARNNRRENGS
jgi:hypothetical protein